MLGCVLIVQELSARTITILQMVSVLIKQEDVWEILRQESCTLAVQLRRRPAPRVPGKARQRLTA